MCWLDDDPVAVAARLAPTRYEPAANVTFAGPFETITPWKWDWFAEP